MAVAYIYRANVTRDEYQRVADEALGGNKPSGLLLHAAGPSEEGEWQIIEVWESEEACDRFARERVIPALERNGMDTSSGPDRTRIEVTNLVGR